RAGRGRGSGARQGQRVAGRPHGQSARRLARPLGAAVGIVADADDPRAAGIDGGEPAGQQVLPPHRPGPGTRTEPVMNLVFDPVWPWSHLGAFLSSAGGAVLLALCLTGALTFALPILVHLRRTAAEKRRTFRIFGLAVVALLVWVAFRGVGSS